MALVGKVAAFGIVNLSVLLFAITHAYQLNGTFYASSVYFAESKLCMIVLGSFGIYCMFLAARLVKAVFLGPLRLIEREHIAEYSWITLSETFLAMTIFKNEIDSAFVFSFATLICFKVFQWIMKDRIEYMEQVVQLPKDFVLKIGSLLGILLFCSSFMVTGNILNVVQKGPSMSILFANEYALTTVSLIGSSVRFLLNCLDAFNPDGAFEQRSSVLFYLDFFVDLFKLIIYSVFFGVVMMYYGLPIHIIRDLYITVISFTKRVRDMIRYHQIMSSLQSRYPDVTAEELEACNDRTCIICREDMVLEVKRLPCGHFFHFKCLKSWLERQQVCPTCRKSVLEVTKEPIRQIIVHHHTHSTESINSTNASEPINTRNSYNNNSNEYLENDNENFIYNNRSANNSSSQLDSIYNDNTNNTNNNNDNNDARKLSRSNSHIQSSFSNSSASLFMSPLRRSASTSNILLSAINQPVSERDGSEKDTLHSEHERLVIAADLERIGRRSRSPLQSNGEASNYFDAPSESTNLSEGSCPLSPLSHVKSRINYVEDLMSEHEKILLKLRQVEDEILLERRNNNEKKDQ